MLASYDTSWDPNQAWDSAPAAPASAPAPAASQWSGQQQTTDDQWNQWGDSNNAVQPGYNYQGGETNGAYVDQQQQSTQQPMTEQQQQAAAVAAGTAANYYKSTEPKQEPINPLEKPVDGGVMALAAFWIVYPIHYMCRLTVPDCRTQKYRNWYPFTFLISMVWISFYSYFMVWMITIIGQTLGIPDTVMGLTFVAAGVSVPDALSSIAVIKEGHGDMAVSNAIGSNVFDILVCLGLPWFIQTAMIMPGSHVHVYSRGLTYSTLSLLSTVAFLLVATHLNGWKLDKRLGIVLMLWYIIFITIASLYELNVFGSWNPPECGSLY